MKVRAGGRSLDEASLARAQSLVGLKGYVTNIDASVMPVGRHRVDTDVRALGARGCHLTRFRTG